MARTGQSKSPRGVPRACRVADETHSVTITNIERSAPTLCVVSMRVDHGDGVDVLVTARQHGQVTKCRLSEGAPDVAEKSDDSGPASNQE